MQAGAEPDADGLELSASGKERLFRRCLARLEFSLELHKGLARVGSYEPGKMLGPSVSDFL